jgi:hypothetical protein
MMMLTLWRSVGSPTTTKTCGAISAPDLIITIPPHGIGASATVIPSTAASAIRATTDPVTMVIPTTTMDMVTDTTVMAIVPTMVSTIRTTDMVDILL